MQHEMSLGDGSRKLTVQKRTVENRYGSAEDACNAWLDGSLWGNPIRYSESNIHVHGCHQPDFSRVMVRFTDGFIQVVKKDVSAA